MSRRVLRSALCLLTLVGALTFVSTEPQARALCLPSPDCFGIGTCAPGPGGEGCVCLVDGQVIGGC